MKINKKLVILFLAFGYFLVIQKIVSLHFFTYLGVNANLIQLQQQILPYSIVIKIMLILMAMSAIAVFLILKNVLETEDVPEIKEKIIILMLILTSVIPLAAWLYVSLIGDLFVALILIIYGLVFTTAIYNIKTE